VAVEVGEGIVARRVQDAGEAGCAAAPAVAGLFDLVELNVLREMD
jgi:hypothetical protein